MENSRFRILILILLGVIALLLRFLLVPNPGFEADIAFWKSWGLGPFDVGLVKSLHITNNNYPAPFAYLLWLITWIYSFFADPHNFNEFWKNTNVLFLTLVKLPAIIADFGIAAILFWFGKKLAPMQNRDWNSATSPVDSHSKLQKKGFPTSVFSLLTSHFSLLFPLLYLFNPVSLIDGALWGQVDSPGVFIFLVAVVMAIKKKPFLAGIIYMFALMTKLQNMIYGPLFFLFIWQITGFEGLIKSAAGATLAFFGLNIEFLRDHDMGRVWESLVGNFDYFPWLSLNAYNLWWIVARGIGMGVSDKILTIGIINAKTTGLILFSGFYFLAILTMFLQKVTRDTIYVTRKTIDASHLTFHVSHLTNCFFTSLIIVNAAFFLFQTQSHDRYAFPLIVFLLIWGILLIHKMLFKTNGSWAGPTIQIAIQFFIIGYILFSLIYFLNLHTAFIANYPQNGFQWLLFLNQPFWTIFIAVCLLLLFILFLIVNRKTIGTAHFLILFIIVPSALCIMNYPLIFRQPVSLTKFKPVIASQGYGLLGANMPVLTGTESGKWNRLSVQYAFYKKGIGTHAKSVHSYNINKQFRKFFTDYGIDTQAGTHGSAVFRIYGDTKLLFQSDPIKRFDYPRHAEVDITGVKMLTLETDNAGDGITDDHTDWLNPQLYP